MVFGVNMGLAKQGYENLRSIVFGEKKPAEILTPSAEEIKQQLTPSVSPGETIREIGSDGAKILGDITGFSDWKKYAIIAGAAGLGLFLLSRR